MNQVRDELTNRWNDTDIYWIWKIAFNTCRKQNCHDIAHITCVVLKLIQILFNAAQRLGWVPEMLPTFVFFFFYHYYPGQEINNIFSVDRWFNTSYDKPATGRKRTFNLFFRNLHSAPYLTYTLNKTINERNKNAFRRKLWINIFAPLLKRRLTLKRKPVLPWSTFRITPKADLRAGKRPGPGCSKSL